MIDIMGYVLAVLIAIAGVLVAVNLRGAAANRRAVETNRRVAERNGQNAEEVLECMRQWHALQQATVAEMPRYSAGGGWIVAGEVGPEDELLGAYLIEIRRN